MEDIEIELPPDNKLDPAIDPAIERARISNEKYKDQWILCCSKTDRHFFKYLTQIVMGSCVMIFSMYQISQGSENNEIYFSLLSGTLGLFLPHPSASSSD